MRKLFLLEDDLSLISGLTFAFKKQGFALDTARTLAEAEVLWSDGKYDLLVLDVSLPDGSGFDFCQKVRRTSNVPILFLTASDEEMNRRHCFQRSFVCFINLRYYKAYRQLRQKAITTPNNLSP